MGVMKNQCIEDQERLAQGDGECTSFADYLAAYEARAVSLMNHPSASHGVGANMRAVNFQQKRVRNPLPNGR